jgi:hypothetical protein
MKTKYSLLPSVLILTTFICFTNGANGVEPVKPVDVTINITVPCKPDDSTCNMAHGVANIAFSNSKDSQASVLLNPPVSQNSEDRTENRLWHASLLPGTYDITVAPRGEGYVKAITYGKEDVMHGHLVVRPGEKPEPIKIAIAPGGTIEGMTTKNGKPFPGRIYDLTPPNGMLSVTSLHGPQKYMYSIEGRAPGPHILCALDVKDVDSLPAHALDPAVLDHCKGIEKTVTVQEGKKVRADLEVTSLNAGSKK